MKLQKFTFFGVRLTFEPNAYRRWVKTLLLRYFNYKLFLGCFPLFFGASQLMSSQYRNQFFSYFVEKTLPGTSLPHQTMSWETFDRTQRAAPEEYKQVDLYHDSILIQCKKKSQKDQQIYIITVSYTHLTLPTKA